jgi:hypothetical protein
LRAHPTFTLALVLTLVQVLTGCVENTPAAVFGDEPFFRCNVQPVLDRSCSAIACHGDAKRPFHVFTRNRLRLAYEGEDLILPLTDAELAANFDNARAFLDVPAEDSWLVRKPLAQAAGGWFHLGDHLFGGGDVWLAVDDPDFQTILSWARGDTQDPSCTYAGSL